MGVQVRAAVEPHVTLLAEHRVAYMSAQHMRAQCFPVARCKVTLTTAVHTVLVILISWTFRFYLRKASLFQIFPFNIKRFQKFRHVFLIRSLFPRTLFLGPRKEKKFWLVQITRGATALIT